MASIMFKYLIDSILLIVRKISLATILITGIYRIVALCFIK